MLLSEPSETQFDLRFWLFGTHVRVHPMFWLISAWLGWDGTMSGGDTRTGLIYLALWVICVFTSILLHEFGHIWMGRLFGSHGHIVLHGFGGLAIGSNALNRGWQRFLVSFAGPLIQFAFFGVLLLVLIFVLPLVPKDWHKPVGVTLGFLLEINLFWPILNLLPIWPLDGGQMAREVFLGVAPRSGLYLSLLVSALTSGLLAVHCLMVTYYPHWPLTPYLPFGDPFMAIFFALFCVQSIMALSALNVSRRREYSDDDFPWER